MAIYDRDYLTTLPLLYEKAYEYSGGDWNKYNNDVGDTLLKLLASTSHTVDYYYRRFLTSLILPNDAWDQKSLIWELTGYKPAYVRADYLMVQLYWPDCGLDTYVPLYQYTPFKITADGVEYTFLCAQDYIIPPLTTRVNIRLVNGELVTIEQDYTQVENNKIKLSDDDIDYDLVTVIVSGVKWTQVRNVFYSPDTERIFSVHKESDGVYLYLHKSWQEYVDSYDTTFTIYFVKPAYDFSMYTDDCMQVEFATELLTIDGDDVSQFYRIIPLLNSDEAIDATNLMPSTTEGNRAITTLDFEANAALFPGIASSKAYDWNTPEVCQTPFEVALVACDSKGDLSEHMKQVLKSYLESISSPLLNVNVLAPVFAKQDILVLLDIGDYRGTLAEIEIKKLVTRTLKEFYTIGNLPPGRIVKTKELNSLLLHSDSRIYFATTTFLNSPVRSPLLIPVLGNVVTITSAEAFSYYDYGEGLDKSYIGLRRYEWPDVKERQSGVNVFFSFDLRVNMLNPIDKLPLQVFDSVGSNEFSPKFEIRGEDFVVSDQFLYKFASGGEANGPRFMFVYETDGTSVLMKLNKTLTNSVQAELKFENAGGAFFVDPGITELPVVDDGLLAVKTVLAAAFNGISGLVDDAGDLFEITATDIIFPEEPLVPLLSQGMNEYPRLNSGGLDASLESSTPLRGKSNIGQAGGLVGGPGDIPDIIRVGSSDKGVANERNSSGGETYIFGDAALGNESSDIVITGDVIPEMSLDAGVGDERTFVYVPYTDSIVKELVKFGEQADIRKITLTVKEIMFHDYVVYKDLTFKSKGRYTPDPDAYGDLTFKASVNLEVMHNVTEFIATKPDIYDEESPYEMEYMIRERNGNELTWYFVNTSAVHSVAGTYEIGRGVHVGFRLLRDTGVYVETDVVTSRGFIYSAEMQASDFYITALP